jgi:hypothetical protein
MYPIAFHARCRKNQQQLVINMDGFIYLLVNLSARPNIVRRKPAPDAFVLEIGI